MSIVGASEWGNAVRRDQLRRRLEATGSDEVRRRLGAIEQRKQEHQQEVELRERSRQRNLADMEGREGQRWQESKKYRRERRRQDVLGSLFWALVLAGLIAVGVFFGWHGVEVAFGAIFLLGLLAGTVWFFGSLFYIMVYQGYFHLRYTRNGYCPERGCHAKGEFVIEGSQGGQYYSEVTHLVCPNGHGSIPMGDRHTSEWAGF